MPTDVNIDLGPILKPIVTELATRIAMLEIKQEAEGPLSEEVLKARVLERAQSIGEAIDKKIKPIKVSV